MLQDPKHAHQGACSVIHMLIFTTANLYATFDIHSFTCSRSRMGAQNFQIDQVTHYLTMSSYHL